MEIIVNKSINHINRQPASWENNILFIGGFEEKFKEQSEDLLEGWVDKGHFISRLYIDQLSEKTSFYGTTDTFIQHLNRGLSYINFVGHGGGAVWGDRSILGLSDVDNINNGNKLPFVTSMTCFTADYANPNSLGRKMLIHENGGAIGWFGSAGKGWIGSDYLLIEPLNQLLYSGADYTIGEMINISKMIYYVSNPNTSRRAKTMLYQFNIAGDPALKLKNILSGASTLTPNNPESGEQININIESSSSDSVYYQFYQPKLDSIEIETAQDTTLYQYFYYDNYSANQPTYVGQTNNVTYTLPNTSENGIHNFNISYKSGNNVVQSNNSFAIEGTKIEIIKINPENPTYLESIQVKASISDKHGINSVQLFIDNEYWSDMTNVSDDIYELINPIPPQPASTYIRIYIRVVDGNGNETISPEQIISIYTLPNIRPNSLYFKIDEAISLTAEIENTKVAPTTSDVKLYIYKNNNWNLIGEKNINFDGQDTKLINFTGFYPNGINVYRVIAKSDIAQSSTADDTLEIAVPTENFWIINNLGTTEDGINHSAVGNEIVTVSIEPGSVENNQIIEIKNISDSVVLSQPDFEVVQFDEGNFAFDINLDSPNKYEINWFVPGQIDDPIKMYKYYSEYLTWLPVSNVTITNNTVNFESEGSGMLAFLNNNDVESPLHQCFG